MSNSYRKLCNLLAASNISEREIYEFITTLHTISPHEVIDYVTDVRKMLTTEFNHYNQNSKYWNNNHSNHKLSTLTTQCFKLVAFFLVLFFCKSSKS